MLNLRKEILMYFWYEIVKGILGANRNNSGTLERGYEFVFITSSNFGRLGFVIQR